MAENGQPPLPPAAVPAPAPNPVEPRVAQEVCRKYVWGTCNKFTNCRFRHEHKFEEMLEILKFCHNFQNKGVCDFDRCSYLHTTSQEEFLFKTEGIIPRVLQERYAAQAGAVSPAVTAAPPPTSGFAYTMMPDAESMLLPPPPPPPVAAAAAAQQLQPPPPPATPPPAALAPRATVNNANVHGFNPSLPTFTYPASAPPNVATTIPVFDASRPPPNFPAPEKTVSGTKRRRSGDPEGAAPRKMAKTTPNRQCEQCNLRRIRSAEIERMIQQMIVQEADLSLAYRKKREQFLQKKKILLSLISPEHQRAIEEYIDGIPAHPQDANQYQQLARQLNANNHSNTKQMIMQLMEMLLNKTFEGASLPSAAPLFRCLEESPNLPPFIRQNPAQRPFAVEDNSPMSVLMNTVNRLLANRPAVPENNDIASMLAMIQNEAARNEAPPPRPPAEFARGGYPDAVAGPSAAVAVRPPAPAYQYGYQEAGPSHAAPPTRPTVRGYNYQEAGPSQAAVAPFSFHVPPPPPPPGPSAYAPYAHPAAPYAHPAAMGRRERH